MLPHSHSISVFCGGGARDTFFNTRMNYKKTAMMYRTVSVERYSILQRLGDKRVELWHRSQEMHVHHGDLMLQSRGWENEDVTVEQTCIKLFKTSSSTVHSMTDCMLLTLRSQLQGHF